ncbi:MAG TPA: choice-of-anchor Q domain-containing protein, partial [Nitrososphaera sp.]|nr:choice-of-anchor Q domain-containing protein [Nitrososphaera sp.]
QTDTRIKRMRFSIIGVLLLCAMALQTHAATITVTNTNDSGSGSLRQAPVDVNEGDTINFAVTGTIGLTSGELAVDKSITISGPGPNMLTVSRSSNTQFRICHVMPGHTVTIQGLTISGGHAHFDIAGGILNDHATLTLTNCAVATNEGNYGGRGVYNDGSNGSAALTITNSTISDNTALNQLAGVGGGIVNTGLLIATNSTLSNNHADGDGGGIHNSGLVNISSTTISRNFAYSNGLSSGGSIRNLESGVIHIGNTILNADSTDPVFSNSALVISRGYNLCSDNCSGLLTSVGDRIDTDPILGPLGNYGGRTFTHGLLPGSPAIDMGDPNFIPPPFSDQRGSGYQRIYGGRVDIGSFELQPVPPLTELRH